MIWALLLPLWLLVLIGVGILFKLSAIRRQLEDMIRLFLEMTE